MFKPNTSARVQTQDQCKVLLQVSNPGPGPVSVFKPNTSARTQTQDQCQCSTQHQPDPGSHIVLTSYLYLIYTNIKPRHTASFCVRFRIESQDINNRSRNVESIKSGPVPSDVGLRDHLMHQALSPQPPCLSYSSEN